MRRRLGARLRIRTKGTRENIFPNEKRKLCHKKRAYKI
jgi:hypothetical protein